MINYFQIDVEQLENRKKLLKNICSDALLKYGCIEKITIQEYDLTLLTTLYNIETNCDTKKSVEPVIIKKFTDFQEFDYYDLLLAYISFDGIERLMPLKKLMWKRIIEEKNNIYEFLIKDDYGAGALSYYFRIKQNELDMPANILDRIKRNIISNICKNNDYGTVDIAIYNFSKTFDLLDYSENQKELIVRAIINHQNENGSWGGKYGFYTSFALKALMGVGINNREVSNSIRLGLNYACTNESYLEQINSVAMMQELFCYMERYKYGSN